MIIYTCPKCGGDIYHTCICTLPPIDVWACLDCDWKYEEKNGIEDVKKARWYIDRLIKELENV